MVSVPTVSADDTIQTAKITDGVVNIDYPSKYAGRSVTIEDGHYQYANLTLDANGDASKDLKTGASFRTEAPDYVYLNFEGFANPIQRGTSLVKELSGYRLMFKQNFNATEHFQFDASDVLAFGIGFNIDIVQASTIKRDVIYTYYGLDTSNTYDAIHAIVEPSTQATYSGTSRPFFATGQADFGAYPDPSGDMVYDLPFIFEGKRYPGVVLR